MICKAKGSLPVSNGDVGPRFVLHFTAVCFRFWRCRLRVAGLVGLLAVSGCAATGSPSASTTSNGGHTDVLTLRNKHLVLGVLPEVGGRVVRFAPVGGANLLDARPGQWRPPYPKPAVNTPFVEYRGHIVWVGPQARWWADQDVSRARREAKHPRWMPDPWTIYGRYRVVEHTKRKLVLRAPTSPITGLAMTKTYELTGPRQVRLITTATNRRDRPVRWNLWANTRVLPHGCAYVPVQSYWQERLEYGSAAKFVRGGMPSRMTNGWFHFLTTVKPRPPVTQLQAEAYLQPPMGLIAYFQGHHAFILRVVRTPSDKLPPQESFVNIFALRGPSVRDILELEFHGPLTPLGPGRSMTLTETWQLLDYPGPASAEAQTRFLNKRFAWGASGAGSR